MTTTTSLKTWGEIADYTWDKCWRRQRSAKDSLNKIKVITSFWGPSLPLKQLGKGHTWLELQNDLSREGEKSNATINRYLSCALHAVKFTYELGLHECKCPKVERLDESETSTRQAWFTKDQVEKLAHFAVDIYDNQLLADAIIFSAYTGVRQGELLKAKVRDIDHESNVIWIGGRPDTRTKSGKERSVPLNKKLIPIIERQTKNREPNDLLFGDDFLSSDQLYKQFKKVRRLAGIDDDYVWHSLRHSFATWCGAVEHPRAVMAAMGHSSMETTLKYCKKYDKAVHAMVSKL